MALKINIKGALPYLATIAIYCIVSLLYFSPQLSGDKLIQHDVQQYEGMNRDIEQSRRETGVDPQWNGSMFGGMPAYLINVDYPAQFIKPAVAQITKVVAEPAAFILFAMCAMWLMLIMMGMNCWVAMVGGLMYGLSTYFFLIIGAGHITKMWALVYAPLMFAGCYKTLRGNMWAGAALTALFTSLEVGANHPQITYYFGLAMVAFWISEMVVALRERKASDFTRRTALLIVAGVLGVMSNLSPLWYTTQHTPDTIRGGSELTQEGAEHGHSGLDIDYATAWSYGRTESLNMLIPDLMGRDSATPFSADGAVAKALAPYNMQGLATQLPAYWGTQPYTGGPTYIGAVVLLLALLGLLLAKGRERWWIVAISVLMLLLSWGNNLLWFTELMFKILPGYNKFRTVSMTLVVLEWSMPLLAAFALWRVWQGNIERAKINRALYTSVGVVGGIALLIAALGTTLFGFGAESSIEQLMSFGFPADIATNVAAAMASERAAMASADALRTLLFVVASGAAVWLCVNQKIAKGWMIAAVAVLTLADLVPVNMRFLSHDDFKPASMTKIRPTNIDKYIMRDKSLGYRVFNRSVSPFNDATTSYFHRSVGGYHGAKLARYQDMIDHYLNRGDEEMLNMLNTKYTIQRNEKDSLSVVLRQGANGAAWLVKFVDEVASPAAEIEQLGHTATKSAAVVDKRFGIGNRTLSGEGTIQMVEYQPNYQKYEYNAPEESVAIFSEIYYDKGWSAYIDGESAPYFRANYILRGMELPAGKHTIEWRFRAPQWGLIEGVTLAASLIIILSILALLIYEGRKKIKA